jgi:hypothetical protein
MKFLARNDVTKHRSRELNESARISGRAQHNFAHAVAATIALKLKVTEELAGRGGGEIVLAKARTEHNDFIDFAIFLCSLVLNVSATFFFPSLECICQ